MKGRVLIIDEDAKARIKALYDYSVAHQYTWEDILGVVKDQHKAAGNNPMHVIHLDHGYRIVFSLEQQPPGTVAHLSISVDGPKKWPSIESVQLISSEFRLNGDILTDTINIWQEEGSLTPDGKTPLNAINVMWLYEPVSV